MFDYHFISSSSLVIGHSTMYIEPDRYPGPVSTYNNKSM